MLLKVSRWVTGSVFVFLALLSPLIPSVAHADGGAPNLAYVAGTTQGVTVIDVAQQKVTSTISAGGDPHAILLSPDARFLYATEPKLGHVEILSAKTGQAFCTANVPGQPTLLAIDNASNTLYVAGNGSSSVTALDPTSCSTKHVFQTKGPVYGLAVAGIGSSLSANSGDQLWVANPDALTVLDDSSGQQVNSIPISGGPNYVTIPPGSTVYATTRQGSVVAVGLDGKKVDTLVTGGIYGPMDYDAITGEVYVPDQQKNRLIVLAPVNAGFAPPPEPSRTITLGVKPESVAITSDGLLGFVALAGGNVAMIDIAGRHILNTIPVSGDPHFIITGLYPPVIGTTPQQANTLVTIINILAYIFVFALLIVPILLFRRYAKAQKSEGGKNKGN